MQHAPWGDKQEPEYWKQETRDILRLTDFSKDTLKKMLHIYNQSETGNHTIQILMACDVLPGGNLSNGQFELIFNGCNYFMLEEDLSTWTAVGKAAEILRQEWEESGFAKYLKTAWQINCVQMLLSHLEYGKEILLRTDTLKIHVIHKV
ncbi:H-2 class I histocompatibility antigen, Q10 alpha chain-like [Onychomys torridus]|uniref:H-2 class I histocompatibility antigen, Q10 alpha chain-like n=1 Tax=Onychomys torridus TaxID=38674 RepID=UPI00167F6FAF|nr:H-2 class I histocompatibility antigen, Q10 alpha chain-like [Onychomys torridus]